MVWERNGTPDTLTVAGDNITISDLTKLKVNVILEHSLNTGGVTRSSLRVGDGSVDSGNNYAFRRSTNGGTEGVFTNGTVIHASSGAVADDEFTVSYMCAVSGEELIAITNDVRRSTAGAANAPTRDETVGKWVTTTQIDNVNAFNDQAGSFDTDSNLSVLSDVVEAPAAVGGWVELGRTTLGSAGDDIDVTSLADKRYLMVLENFYETAGDVTSAYQFNGDTSNIYAMRLSPNGATDTTSVSRSNLDAKNPSTDSDYFGIRYIANLSTNEKLAMINSMTGNDDGAGVAPNRNENYGKWTNTTNAISRVQTRNLGGAGDYAIGSEIVVLGWDPTDTHTNNFWEEIFSETLTSNLQEFDTGTITAKKYLWLQFYQVGHTGNTALTFNLDSGTNYARRHEINGAADATVVSQTSLLNVLTGGTGDTQTLTNMFIINNSANEKLMTFSTTFDNGTGSGTAPQKILGVCKWDNTSAQITRVVVADSGTGFNAPSFLKIWGSD